MITVDDREIAEHPDIPELLGVPITVQRLEAADYAFLGRDSEPIGIERSEISNLIWKLRNGELESQLSRCDVNYSTVILLVEGVYDHVGGFLAHYRKNREGNTYYRNRIEPNTRYADIKALMVRVSELGIEVLESSSFDCSMQLIRTIYQQRTKPEEEHQLFKKIRQVRIPVKLSANPAVPRLLALCDRLPEKVAIRLIYKYGSIWNIIHTDDRELLEIEGMGRGLLNRLKMGVGRC